jgi:hypothetical protein
MIAGTAAANGAGTLSLRIGMGLSTGARLSCDPATASAFLGQASISTVAPLPKQYEKVYTAEHFDFSGDTAAGRPAKSFEAHTRSR